MSPTSKTIAGFPKNTFVLICLLTVVAAVLSWFRLFYHPLQPSIVVPTYSPISESKLSKVPKPSLPENIIRPLTITNVSLDTRSNLPTSMSLISASPSSILKDTASQIALKLRLPLLKSTPPDLTWKNSFATLIANTDDQSFSYFINSPSPAATTSAVPDPVKSAAVAENLLKLLSLWQNNISLNKNAIVFLQAQAIDLMPVKHPQNANFIQLTYQYLINNIPVVISTQENPISLQVASNSQVTSFVIYPLSIATTRTEAYPTIALDKISSLVQNQAAKLISLEPNDYINPTTSTEISSFSINSIQAAYYYSPTQNLLYPAYLIKGKGKFSDSAKAVLTFLLSAIDPQYYQ